MSSKVFEKYIGKECSIHTIDNYVSGKIVSVIDQWIEVETTEAIELVNTEFIEKIEIPSK
ncbi:MAG: hypothetical protein LRY71_14205 [Bacillaceae bacterium]|nr:hypothetical protein [Bacillaceae bacterium]